MTQKQTHKDVSSVTLNEDLYHKGVNGTAVMILHGYTSHIKQTDILFEYLKRKGYTVIRPIMPGHERNDNDEELLQYGPNDWLQCAKKHLNMIESEAKEIYVVGMSFGGNIALSLCNMEPSKIHGLIAMEMPVQFVPVIRWSGRFLLPIGRLIGIKYVAKDTIFYKRRHRGRGEGEISTKISTKMLSYIRDYVNRDTRRELKSVKTPCLFIQAQNSDVLSKKNVEIISKHVSTKHRRLYLVDVDNHDLNLMDETGKMLMLEEIYEFINHLAKDAKKGEAT